MFVTKIVKHGSGHAILLPKLVMQFEGVKEGQLIEVSIRNQSSNTPKGGGLDHNPAEDHKVVDHHWETIKWKNKNEEEE